MTDGLKGTELPLGEVADILRDHIEAVIESDRKLTLLPTLVGDPGIGKSESIKTLAHEMGYDYKIFSLGALPLEFFSGLPEMKLESQPDFHKGGEMREVNVTEWTVADLIKTINKETIEALEKGKRGLIVLLDDIHTVDTTTQKYLFEFFQNGTLQNYKIHPAAVMVAAMNGKESAGLEGFLSAVLNRMSLYFVKFDLDHWINVVGNHINPIVSSFAKSSVGKEFFTGANSTVGASPSPRTWTQLATFIDSLERKYQGRELKRKIDIAANAFVGSRAAAEFKTHVAMFMEFNHTEILRKKDPALRVEPDFMKQLLMAYIIAYAKSKSDYQYAFDVIAANKERTTFVTQAIQLFVAQFMAVNKEGDTKKISMFSELLDMLLDKEKYGEEVVNYIATVYTCTTL